MNKKSRVVIKTGKRGTCEMFIVCEKTKNVIPVVGVEHHGVVALAQLLVEMRRCGMELPESVIDEFQTK